MARRRLTLPSLQEMKHRREKIAVLTAYDATFAAVLDQAGVDVLLVGDSLGMVVQGHDSTLPVTIADMVYHCRCVSHGAHRPLIVADLPFMTYATAERAAEHAARLIQEGGAQMVKLEGGLSRTDIVRFLVNQNIPVCGHLGLQPQSIHRLGAYSVQCRDEASANRLLEDAAVLRSAGISMLVLECVPSDLAGTVSRELDIPVIGIGAGPDCDGQVLVLHDMLGLHPASAPRFVKDFMQGATTIPDAIANYVAEVRAGQFPAPEHGY